MWSVLAGTAATAFTVPAMSSRPGAKTSSALAVIGSTTRTPRSPCARRMRPTMTRSSEASRFTCQGPRPRTKSKSKSDECNPGLGLGLGTLGFFVRRQRNRRPLQLLREPCFVPRLEDTRTPQERTNGVRRQRTVVEPVIGAVLLDLEAVFCLTRVVVTDDLDEPTIARARVLSDRSEE